MLEKKMVWMRCLRRPSLFWTYKPNTYSEMYTYAVYSCEVFGLSFHFAMHNAPHRRLCLLHLSIVKIENSASFFLSRGLIFIFSLLPCVCYDCRHCILRDGFCICVLPSYVMVVDLWATTASPLTRDMYLNNVLIMPKPRCSVTLFSCA